MLLTGLLLRVRPLFDGEILVFRDWFVGGGAMVNIEDSRSLDVLWGFDSEWRL